MAARAGIARNTLRAIEAGDPGSSIGNYLRVMSVLGISGELALLAGDCLQPSAPRQRCGTITALRYCGQGTGAGTECPTPAEDLQSVALHEEAVRRVKAEPQLIAQAIETARRRIETGDPRAAGLWRDSIDVLRHRAWRKVLSRTRGAQQLRQASPLVTVLPENARKVILDQVAALRRGIEPGGDPLPAAIDAEKAP